MKPFLKLIVLVICFVFIYSAKAEDASANKLINDLMRIKVSDRKKLKETIHTWSGFSDESQILPLLETLTIDPKKQGRSFYVNRVLLVMKVSKEVKLTQVENFYRKQKIPAVKVDSILLLADLSKTPQENEGFIKLVFDQLEEFTPVPSRHKEAQFPFRVSDHAYRLISEKLNELGYKDELSEFGIGSLFGLNYDDRDQNISLMKSWIKQKYPNISANNRLSKNKPSKERTPRRVDQGEVTQTNTRKKQSDLSSQERMAKEEGSFQRLYVVLVMVLIGIVFWYLKLKSS